MSRHPACPDARTLLEFTLGKLSAPAADGVRAHIARCEDCSVTIEKLKSDPASADAATGNALDGYTAIADTPTLTACYLEANDDSDDLPFLLPSGNPKAIGKVDNYEVLRVLGRGGMGVVLDAFDTVLHRRVAIKVLSPHLATSKNAHRRFLREARAAAGINHANVVTIHAVEEKVPYLVMEYVPGRTLRDRIRLTSSLDLISSLRIGAQIAAGLAAAHLHGVIHRDVKPANIMLEDGIERVKITDFGLALVALDASQVSSADRPVGTPAYMSPEQVGGGRVDARSDLFSLGCVMYAMGSGKSPFQGNNTLAVARQVADHMPPPLHEVNPDTPRFLSEIVTRLLAKNPAERFQTADEVRDVLLHHLAALNQGGSDGLTNTVPLSLPRRSRRNLLPAAVLMVIIGAALATTAFLWYTAHPTNSIPQPNRLLTVSQSGAADFRSLKEALAHAGPGATIRVQDAGVYPGQLVLTNPDRLRDLTIESPQGASVENTDTQEPVIAIKNIPGLTLRGLHVKARDRQHCISVEGLCDGLTVDALHLTQPAESSSGAVVFWDGTRGSAERPIVLRNLDVHCGEIGIVLIGDSEKPVAWVHLENNRITGPGVHVAMETGIRDVNIEGNIFTDGRAGVSFSTRQPRSVQRLSVVNNTFFQTTSWLALQDSPLDQVDVRIARNLILQSSQIMAIGQDLTAIAPQWFKDNWWERSGTINEVQARLVADVKEDVKLLSRDAGSPDFLRPDQGAMPKNGTTNDPAHPYIGALAPATAIPSDSHK